ncbi:transmembrane protein 14C-like [Homarus americanus]|uniref:Transmembrane protein 14C-like n=1 Tax=Homarus americanus TaxID=6706 RepID=A0A8J5JA19_HOMAM|nr:transmembrane protein 14C-like [Homarus americanus]KAG7155072.1 Transmembrane protein 14C-like [Homarus americanus]
MGIDYISYAYATAVAMGGVVGYVKAGSVPSLGAGLLFGSLLGFGAYQLSANPANYYLTLGTSTVLGGMMGMRFLNSGKFMPPGLIAVMSLAMVARLGARAAGLTNGRLE